VLLSGLAGAQTAEPETLVTEGIQLRKQGRDTEALERFQKAAEQSPDSPRVLGHLALALHATEQWLKSERVMLEVLRSKDDIWVLRHQAELEKSLESVQDHLAWLEVDSPISGSLWINDVNVGNAPTAGPIRVLANTCVIKLTAPNRPPITKLISIPARHHLNVYMIETIAPMVPPPPVAAPRHTSTQIASSASKAPSPNGARHGIGLTLLGAGVAGIVTSVAVGVDALVQRDRSRRECNEHKCSIDGIKLDALGRHSATLATISFAAGAAALGVSAVLLW
jgi:hypothetical protein